ncbi:MAG TPA: hypothetical protein VKE22_00660 [Haliangiales bacterium]|nr:hypothetical protein [Haliangiales bacterium]
MKTSRLVFACLWALGACAGDAPSAQDDLEPEDREADVDGKAEIWNAANNPAAVDKSFLYFANQLPLSGAGPEPISGDYWAVASDNINVAWDGGMSPAEKYARAFGKNVKDIRDAVSAENGVKGHTERKTCTSDADCEDQHDGSACAAAYDGSVKRCIPTWWGICHGWAPYAVTEPQAKRPVVRTAPDGTQVTFYPGDLEALMSLVYTNVDSKFVSQRCNRAPAGGYGTTVHTDNGGRIVESECRDCNPGSWHILVTNLMGVRKQGFVIDQTSTDEVWNQPAWKYAVVNAKNGQLLEIGKDDANAMLGRSMSMTELLPSTTLAKGDAKSGVWTATAAQTVHFKLSGTGDADLYVRKGVAPTGSSDADCASEGNTAVEDCELAVATGDKIYWLVSGYSQSSSATLGVARPGAGPYEFNPDAKKFWYVEMDFTFVVESQPAQTPRSAADYSRTKRYKYILEGDAAGKIVGGEWVGDSAGDHPDFVWWPTSKPLSDVAGIAYDDVKALNDEAAGAGAGGSVTTLLSNYALPYALWTRSKYVTLVVPAGNTSVKLTMTGTGDASLLARKDSYPRVGSSLNACEQKTAGTANETCTFKVPSGGGTYYVRAKNEQAGSVVTVVAEMIK